MGGRAILGTHEIKKTISVQGMGYRLVREATEVSKAIAIALGYPPELR